MKLKTNFHYTGGNRTVSITWTTPLLTGMSAIVTWALFIVTPSVNKNTRKINIRY